MTKTDKIGLIAEEATIRFLTVERGLTVIDVRDNPEYQKKDIDLIVRDKNGNETTVEVKADTKMGYTDNVFIEIYNELGDNGVRKPGWYGITEAQYICFYDTENRKGYIVDFHKLHTLLESKQTPIRTLYDSYDNKHRGYKLLSIHDILRTFGFAMR